jgi:hypothetical protein
MILSQCLLHLPCIPQLYLKKEEHVNAGSARERARKRRRGDHEIQKMVVYNVKSTYTGIYIMYSWFIVYSMESLIPGREN